MILRPISLEECGKDGRLRGLSAGVYTLEYHDATHLETGRWIQLASLDVHATSIPAGEGPSEQVEQFYTFRADLGDLPEKPDRQKLAKGGRDGAIDLVEYERRVRTVHDAMSLALARLGLLSPDATDDLVREVMKLSSEEGVVLVPDTNALHNGALHWLLRVLRTPAVWVLPLVASMTTVQTRDATLKSLVGRFRPANLRQALRSRGLVNGALGLIERNRGRIQVVEIDPALLRYQKMASGSGTDPDQGDVLEDRLIIEGIHSVLRSMRSRTARRVVTSDVNIARVLSAEGIETLFVPNIVLSHEPLDCLRYDPLLRGFVGAPLHALLWEFTHAFGSVRLVRDGLSVATLECYWPGKSPTEWQAEKLRCSFPQPPQHTGEQGEGAEVPADSSAKPTPQSEMPEASSAATRGERAGSEATALSSASDVKHHPARVRKSPKAAPAVPAPKPRTGPAPIATVLPRASFPQILQLLGAARRQGSGTVDDLVAASRGDAITADTARRCLEILRRAQFIDQNGAVFRPTNDADVADNLLRAGDLDGLSALFERFEPYSVFRAELQSRGRIPRGEIVPLLKARLGTVGTYESERLPRYHILLAQAWSDGSAICDGSRRPTDRDATDAFQEAFAATASVGLAKVSELLPRFCASTGMSPWIAKQRIERLITDRLLPEYSFQPAAGGKPVIRDEVVKGSLDELVVEPVIVDRLHLGERPVFTIGGPAR